MNVLSLLAAPLRWLYTLVSLLLGRLAWQPAPWQRWYAARLRRQPLLHAGLPLLLALVGSAGWWWITRPPPLDPEALRVHLEPPAATRYHDSPPTLAPLILQFSGSAAPIGQLDGSARGFSLQPPLEGEWRWLADDRLSFLPAADWPVGTKLEVRIDTPTALAPGVRLADAELVFDTAPFSARIVQAQFYQDPLDASIKRASFELQFSHPVAVLDFERALSLQMSDGAGRTLPAPQLELRHAEQRLQAWVHSAALDVPENGGSVRLEVAAAFGAELGGPALAEPLQASVDLPSLYSVRVTELRAQIVDNDRFEPEQVLLLGFNDRLKDEEVARALRVWLLPASHPDPARARQTPYPWRRDEVDDALLARSERVELTPLPAAEAWGQQHAFRFRAEPGQRLYIELERGLRAFGGFLLGQDHRQVETVPDYPTLLRFVGEGALLSLRGERRISIASRNLPGLALEVARVKPDQLQHLVHYNQGSFAQPTLYQPGVDSLTERFEQRLTLPRAAPGQTQYHGIDLGQYFSADRHGLFLLRLFEHDPAAPVQADERYPGEHYDGAGWDGASDARLVLLTDLGVVVKRELDGQRRVYVMSLARGAPVAGATVRALARNGESLHQALTDAEGHARLPDLDGYRREKQATLLTVTLGEDLSFLPLDDRGRQLPLSRFDVGGEINSVDGGELKAWLFSDRGLYRPGDQMHVGMIVRAADWSQPLDGVPLQYELRDPRGTLVVHELLTLDASGLLTQSHQPAWTAATGHWEASLYLRGEAGRRSLIGSTRLQVRDFQPDRLRLRVGFPAAPAQGWITPQAAVAAIEVHNLFGTPAQDRRISSSLRLDPAAPRFANWPEHGFHDPEQAREGYSEALADLRSDAEGRASLTLDLGPYEPASYQLTLLAQAFEAGGGRGVAAQASVLVSANPWLVGLKREGELRYVRRGERRRVHVQAIDSATRAIAVSGLQQVLLERRQVSVLTRQDSGLYRYVSQLREEERARSPLVLDAEGSWLTLATEQPGDFRLEIRDGDERVLNSVGWQVAGEANLSHALERNAELQLSLSKNDYAPGEIIELAIRAPYAGAGLITIERDRVYAQRWFRSDSNASVQQIELPQGLQGLEGNAYVHVQLLRDIGSAEVHTSPLSWAVAPFTIDLGARRLPLQLDAPTVVKPGQTARFSLSSEVPARALLFAVDAGILQVARHRVGDPLEHFYAKRMLQVDSAQILDLLLPEFSQLLALAAPGGDGEAALARQLNPFRRKGDRPAVYWSGLVDLEGRRDFEFEVPDSFNGELKVVALAVSPARIGLARAETRVRADFVLSPNLPQMVAPGDEFEVSVGVANTLPADAADGAAAGEVEVSLQLPASLRLLGAASHRLALPPGREGVVRFRLQAGDTLGTPTLRFVAAAGAARAERQVALSLRPAWPHRSTLQLGSTRSSTRLDELRALYPDYARRSLQTSLSPLVAVEGLGAWLADYPHACTEQLLSQALPALVYASRPELGRLQHDGRGDPFAGTLARLRERRNGDGAIGLWRAGPEVQPFVSTWAGLFLVEAGERGQRVPDDLLGGLNGYLQRLAADRSRGGPQDLAGFRERALAIYLLTRQGRVTSNLLGSLREQIERDRPPGWAQDSGALFLAASYQLLQQPAAAAALLQGPLDWLQASRQPDQWLPYRHYHDEGIARGWLVYLVARHFPQARASVGELAIERLLEPLQRQRHNTLSAALTVLALEAWGAHAEDSAMPRLLALSASPQQPPQAFGERQGLYHGGSYPADSHALQIEPATDATVWYLHRQSGFDRQPPAPSAAGGLEIQRDYLDDTGEVVERVALGQELTVRLRLRALSAAAVDDLAIIDLLPGGFELVLQQAPAQGDSDPQQSADGPAGLPGLAAPGTTLATVHEEWRDDRVVLYASASRAVREYRYRIKATSIGRFRVPPAHAESMYVVQLQARGPASGHIEVMPAADSP